MTKRIKSSVFSILIALVLLGASFSSASAGPPLDIHIEADEIIGDSGELFLASGPAVDAGLVCPYGKVYDLSTTIAGAPGGKFTNLRVLKQFVCGDNNDNVFLVKLVVRLNNTTHETTASWQMVGGTGPYATLNAHGSLAGTPIVPGVSIHDVYDGSVH